jgi:hypothetical protein
VKADVELRHLREGTELGENWGADNLFVALEVLTILDAEVVSARLREALTIVIDGIREGVSDQAAWERRLPRWLVESFAPLTPNPDVKWTLTQWVSWYQPSRREWFFWSAETVDPYFLVVHLETLDLPFSHDSLVFLLQAAGAEDISEPILPPLPS